MSGKFAACLRQGQMYERKAVKLFTHDSVRFPKGCFKEYDFELTRGDTKIKVEVKSDRLTQKTGNLCIEWECNKKPSGLTATTADYWVYYAINDNKEDDVYMFPIDDLRELAPKYRSVAGGDEWRSRMYLVPKTKVIKYLVLNDDIERMNEHNK